MCSHRPCSTFWANWSSGDRRELGSIQLTTALNELARRERYLALETSGTRYNLGVKFGAVEAQIALSLAGVDRQEMLTTLLESVIRIEQGCEVRPWCLRQNCRVGLEPAVLSFDDRQTRNGRASPRLDPSYIFAIPSCP